jgi:hypothetical protein
VAEFVAEFLGGLLLPFLDLSPIDDHVVLVSLAVDVDLVSATTVSLS